jgi:hypothetical protein
MWTSFIVVMFLVSFICLVLFAVSDNNMTKKCRWCYYSNNSDKITKLTHSSFIYIYFASVHVSSNLVRIIRRVNCTNTAFGVCHSV